MNLNQFECENQCGWTLDPGPASGATEVQRRHNNYDCPKLMDERAQAQEDFAAHWWEGARAAAQRAADRGADRFPALCPDGTVRDLLNGDAEVPQ